MDYRVVDVFTDKALLGNPVAVILNANDLTTETMQQFARWTNLSETTFVLKPQNGGDYRLRIFTPGGELPFAGHPSLGTAAALLDANILKKAEGEQVFVQECARGNIPIKKSAHGELSFEIDLDKPTVLDSTQAEELKQCMNEFSLKPGAVVVDAGPHWVVVECEGSLEKFLDTKPNDAAIRDFTVKYGFSGICPFLKVENGVEIRSFAPGEGVSEDPVCGSGNAAVAKYINNSESYKSRQGRAIQRDGHIVCGVKDSTVSVGGKCKITVRGYVNLDK